jgi:hypothetical protein
MSAPSTTLTEQMPAKRQRLKAESRLTSSNSADDVPEEGVDFRLRKWFNFTARGLLMSGSDAKGNAESRNL